MHKRWCTSSKEATWKSESQLKLESQLERRKEARRKERSKKKTAQMTVGSQSTLKHFELNTHTDTQLLSMCVLKTNCKHFLQITATTKTTT